MFILFLMVIYFIYWSIICSVLF